MYKMLSFSPIEKEGCNVSVSPPPIKPNFTMKNTLSSTLQHALKRKCGAMDEGDDGNDGNYGNYGLQKSKK